MADRRVAAAKVAVFLACLVPLGLVAFDAFRGRLGAEPIREIQLRTGWWALTFLLITLTITPLRRLSGWNQLIKFRRMLGLFAFTYGLLHLSNYVGVDQFFAWGEIGDDILKRPWITIGFTAFVLMIPLAATSTQGMVRRLGGKRWAALHRLVYVSAACGVFHFLWLVKKDTREPVTFGLILIGLLVWRLRLARKRSATVVETPGGSVPGQTQGLRAGSVGAGLLLLVAGQADAQGHLHKLPATPQTVAYGYYSAAAKPVLRIASGDTLDVETLITNRPDRLEAAGVPPAEVEQSLRDIVAQVTDRGPGGHILTGPVYVEGADSGDVLEVRILDIQLAIPYGYNGCSGFLKTNCEQPSTKIIRLDLTRMVGEFAPGLDIPLHPFFGSMGVAPPADSGRVSSNPPSIHAGNLDNKEFVTGTTLFIPIHTAGALFEVGDGHAAQGDGEVDQTAIETSLRGRLQLIVRKDMHLAWPRGETATHFIAMGMDKDLTRATQIAIQEAVDFLAQARSSSKMDAYRLVSIACDVRITELVDGNVGVHVMIPEDSPAEALIDRS